MTEPTDAEIIALADETRTAEGGANGYILPISFCRAVLAKWGTPPAVAGEPVFAFRRKGLDDFCTCTEERYAELSAKPNLFETRIFYTTPQPTQAQAGAVPTREFMERTLAAMEGVIDVADRKTDEFDALRSCVIELTLMLFSNAKRHTKGADHGR